MEDDRAATNLGEVTEDAQGEDPPQDIKTPRRRFVGRRAAAERAGGQHVDESAKDHKQIQTSRPNTIARTLNRIPDSILHDESLNAAIAHIPSNYNFEIQKTVHRIRESGAKNVALQFPEGLLMFAPLISDIFTQFCPGTDTVIMGDVTYGACCIDDYTARALGCDLLVHYGHSCLVPIDTTKGIKTLYVFVTIGVDTEHLLATIEENFQPGKKIALVGTIQFNATIHSIAPRLRAAGFEILLPRSAPLSAGEILGCTAPTLTASSSKMSESQEDADMILYVGDGRFHLESIMIASPTLRSHTYRYDPYSRRLTHETYEHQEMHNMRRTAIKAARETLRSPSLSVAGPVPRTWGIILGTLGRQGNPNTLDLIEAHLARRGIGCVTLLLSEVMPAKLALMTAEVGVWVQIACPRLSIDWGYAFERPLLSPYEACVALDIKQGSSWSAVEDGAASGNTSGSGALTAEIGTYPMDFYEKSGLGRTRKEDVPMEIEVT